MTGLFRKCFAFVGVLGVAIGGGGAGSAQAYSFSGLGDIPGWGTFATGVSADGSVVVGRRTPSGSFRWTENSGRVDLGALPGGTSFSVATAVSADGSVVVGQSHSYSSGYEAFRWTESGGMVGLGDLPGGGFDSSARGISADGSVVAGAGVSSSGIEAFRWTENGGMVGLGDFPGGRFDSQAWSISADGSVVVGFGNSSSGLEAFRWTESGGMVGLGAGTAFGVSADGSVVVGSSQFSCCSGEAFVWDEANGRRALIQILADQGIDMTGWNLTGAKGISADGLTIVGEGMNPLGFGEAWIATIPEPGTATLLALGITGLAARQRQHRRGTTRRV